ncbi:LacI family DNA-binding transcriptional regulator [Salinithrix halophila]|uniref:LacI family DNA-binding transcriptional regulator n=1 Tax=Salinithrix halophila TaxID=1485204 RepID=A0ABV8JF88_9BACL
MATIRDVAKQARVSVATVSRVLNGNGYVNLATEAKVRMAMEELNYEPNTVARGLAGKRTMMIAMILPDIVNPFFSELARAVEDTARAHQFTVIICNSDDRGAKEKTYIDVLRKRYVDGIIFASNTLGDEEILTMEEQEIPFVLLDRTPGMGRCSVVRSRNVDGARMAVNHLLQSGCRRVAHIAGSGDLLTGRERRRGYLDVVGEKGWFDPGLIVPGHFSVEGGKGAAMALMDHFPDVDGIFAGNDLMAVGALKVLHAMGVKVPDEVSLCGFDGIALTEVTVPELTTVAQPIYEMGATAAMELIRLIEGEPGGPREYELDVLLLKRESTRRRKR